MEDVVGAIGTWGSSVLAAAAVIWGSAVLISGRAPQRELRRGPSASQYGWFCVGLGTALGVIALGNLGGWFRWSTFVGFGLLCWVNIHYHRATRKSVQQRSSART